MLVHVNKKEITELDKLQGKINTKLINGVKVKNYNLLWNKINSSDTLKKLLILVGEQLKEKGLHDLAGTLRQANKKKNLPVQKHAEGEMVDYVSPHGTRKIKKGLLGSGNPNSYKQGGVVEKLKSHGRHGDTEIVDMPEPMVKFFAKVIGKLSRNPKDNLPEFFFGRIVRAITAPVVNLVSQVTGNKGKARNLVNEGIRIGGTVAGSLLGGGPIGAGVGNALGSYATGKNLKDSAISGLKNYGLASVLNMGIGALHKSNMLPASFSNYLAENPTVATSLGLNQATNAVANQATQKAVENQATNVINQQAQNQVAERLKENANSSLLGNMMDGIGSTAKQITPFALPVLAIYSALNKNKQARRDADEENRLRNNWVNQKQAPWLNENIQSAYEDKKNYTPFKKGGAVDVESNKKIDFADKKAPEQTGLVVAKGDGQSDSKHTKIRVNTYIIDASSVADLGNGSSEAGGKVLANFVDKMLKKYNKLLIKKYGKKYPYLPLTPVAIADREGIIEPEVVEILGILSGAKGDVFNRGAKVLANFVQNLREHKRNAPKNTIPPKAKPIEKYFDNNLQKYL